MSLKFYASEKETSYYDSKELTFIVLARGTLTSHELLDECKASQMIGDVNLFFKGDPSDDDFEVEAEIMIAGACPNLSRWTASASFHLSHRKGIPTQRPRLTSPTSRAFIRRIH